MQRNRRVLAGEHDRPFRRPDGAACRLRRDAGRMQRLHERMRRAVHAGSFRRVEVDITVVDAQSGERGEYVLDKVHMNRRRSERGAAIGAGDIFEYGGNAGAGPEVGAHENDSRRRGSRPKTQTYVLAGHIADALHLDRPRDGLLAAILNSFHDRLILELRNGEINKAWQGAATAVYRSQ